jgi:predicted MFS family arabinose efflux permease
MFQATAGFWAYSSKYFTENLGVEWKYYAILLMVKTAMAIPLSFLLSRVKSTKRNSWIAIIFVVWSCLSYLMMMLFPDRWILLFVLYSIPMYPLYNITFFSLVTTITNEKKRATAYGILNSIGTFGYISGILLLGLFADLSSKGIEIMFLVSVIFACVTLMIAILMFVIRTRKEITMPVKDIEEIKEAQS